jgi:hypothetical protein
MSEQRPGMRERPTTPPPPPVPSAEEIPNLTHGLGYIEWLSLVRRGPAGLDS